MGITFLFPVSLTPAAIRELLAQAYAQATPPEAIPDTAAHTLSLHLPVALSAQVSAHAEKRQVAPSRETAERAYAQWQLQQLRAGPTPTTAAPTIQPTTPGDDLAILREKAQQYAQEAINAGKIGFIEAATGLGKSRLLARAATFIVANKPTPRVVICAPTVVVLSQLLRESRLVPNFPAQVAVLLGKGQFLHEARARTGMTELLRATTCTETEQAQIEAVTAWLDDNAPVKSSIGAVLAHYMPDLTHLMEDARALGPDLPLEGWSLARAPEEDESDEDEAGRAHLRLAREKATHAPILFCTHAYLAAQLRLSIVRQEPHPVTEATHLIIDEAHLFEETVARSLGFRYSAYAALYWFTHDYTGPKKNAICTAATNIRTELSRLSHHGDGPLYDEKLAGEIHQLFAPLAKLVKPEHAPDYARCIKALAQPEALLFLLFSQVRKYPTVMTGPRTVRKFLQKHLWSRLKGALLYSATLYTYNKDDRPSADLERIKLGIESTQAMQFPPLIYADIFAAPTLHLPAATDLDLTYPGGDREADNDEPYKKWADAIITRLTAVARTAVGGTLVLCNSYADLRALGTRLTPVLGARLLAGEHSTVHQAAKFTAAAREGARPVWLATGAAWQGLDLRDDRAQDASQDTLLTDLVILRLPFGLNSSTTHQCRREWLNYEAEIHETMIRLKQGLGRLIRRPGLLHRRIHLLDVRCVTLPRGHYRVYARYLRKYRHQLPLIF